MKPAFNQRRVFAQYRDNMNPYKPINGRKYTITHSDTTAELFVFIAENFAENQVTKLRDEVKLAWERNRNDYVLKGFVVIDGKDIKGDSALRNEIFYNEMPIALQAMRQADRFLFEQNTFLDSAHVFIKFISENPRYNKIYDFGCIGNYR